MISKRRLPAFSVEIPMDTATGGVYLHVIFGVIKLHFCRIVSDSLSEYEGIAKLKLQAYCLVNIFNKNALFVIEKPVKGMIPKQDL